ncbi:MAG TPA: ATP-binding cassette domain-containing protein, partial [Acidimicrobiales bacterium]|nr:ATP-binding cassette domain-containing protein [Acidimicrobiales bacterium]
MTPTHRANTRGSPHELVIEGLRVGVSGREVLGGIDLTVRSGEVHAVMGPNGSGKSTLSHVIMGKPGYLVLGGSVTLDGHDLLALEPWQRARLGLFLAPQYPVEVPGVGLTQMLTEAVAAPQGDLSATELEELESAVAKRTTSEASKLGVGTSLLDRSLNV